MTVYELTEEAGRALQPALKELLDWGRRYGPEPSADDAAQPGWGLLGAAGRPTALPAGQTCELRVGPEVFYLGSDAGVLTVRRGPAPDGDAVVTTSAGTLFSLLAGQTTVTGAVRDSAVDGDAGVARRALEPLAAAKDHGAPESGAGQVRQAVDARGVSLAAVRSVVGAAGRHGLLLGGLLWSFVLLAGGLARQRRSGIRAGLSIPLRAPGPGLGQWLGVGACLACGESAADEGFDHEGGRGAFTAAALRAIGRGAEVICLGCAGLAARCPRPPCNG